MSTTTRPSRQKPSTRKTAQPAATPAAWPAWQQHLRERAAPRGWQALWPKLAESPLHWGLESLSPEDSTTALLALLQRFAERPQASSQLVGELTLWRARLADVGCHWQPGLTALAWAHTLPQLAQLLSPESWTGILNDLVKLSADAAALQPIDDPLSHQLLTVELPLTLAYLFPELAECTSLVSQARKLWAWAAEEATDGEGLLPGRHLHQTKALLGCWTRSHALASASSAKPDEDVQVQFEWLLRQTLRLAREDGSLCFTPRGAQDDLAALVKAALAATDDTEDHQLAKAAFEGVKLKAAPKKPKKDSKPKKVLPDPFVHSEWSNAALLRGTWELNAPRLAVAYDQQQVRCELLANGHLLLAGAWTAEVEIDGWTWKPSEDWEEVCWHTDEDIVYLELETKLTDGWKLQRQMMLATKERLLLLADVVLGETSAQVTYRGSLPLANNFRFLPADETREGYLAGKRSQALVLPLALSEWRSEAGVGELVAKDRSLELSQTQTGSRLFAPLWIDLHSERIRKECTWRQLTVAQQLTIQPRDVAVAYRAQVGKEQFCLYRSLAKKANRTFLGQNVVNEFCAARFLPDGTTVTMLEIE